MEASIQRIGGDKQDRTADLLHAMQALSQLSYTPYAKKRDYDLFLIAAQVFLTQNCFSTHIILQSGWNFNRAIGLLMVFEQRDQRPPYCQTRAI